jgi:hypothetical protein
MQYEVDYSCPLWPLSDYGGYLMLATLESNSDLSSSSV